ncbi:MAG: hypothetical protein AAGU75_12615 [Bacillota bacterium]
MKHSGHIQIIGTRRLFLFGCTALRKMLAPDCDRFLTLDSFHYANQYTLELCRLKFEQIKSLDLKVQQIINWMINVIDIRLKKIAR